MLYLMDDVDSYDMYELQAARQRTEHVRRSSSGLKIIIERKFIQGQAKEPCKFKCFQGQAHESCKFI